MKRKIVFISFAVIVAFAIFSLVFFFNANKRITTYKIYADFNELHFLDEYIISNNLKDKNLTTQSVSDSYFGKIRFENTDYDFYAYSFQTDSDAQNYFCLSSGKTTRRSADYSLSITLTKINLIVFKDNKCYQVIGSTTVKRFNSFHKYLNSIFSEEIQII